MNEFLMKMIYPQSKSSQIKSSLVKAFSSSHIWMWALDYKESWVPKNWCFWTVVLEKTLESPLNGKEIHPKRNQSWSWNSNTLATWCKELNHLKRPWHWERLRAGGEREDRGWDGWMASPTWCTWIWADSGSWWWTGRLGVLWFMGLQRVRHDWATELKWTECERWTFGFCWSDAWRSAYLGP